MATYCLRRSFLSVSILLAAVLAILPPLSVAKSKEVTLKRVYEHKQKGSSKGRMIATLDSASELLYVVEIDRARVRIIDWRAGKEVRNRDFSSLPCDRLNPEWWEKIAPGRPVTEWELVPGTSWGYMAYCSSVFLVDAHTLEVMRKLVDGAKEVGSVLFSPNGQLVLISKRHPTEPQFHVQLYETHTWELVREWDTGIGHFALFGPNGRHAVFGTFRRSPKGKIEACGLAVRQIPSLRLISQWEVELVEERTGPCPMPLEFLPHSEDKVVETHMLPHGRKGIGLRDVWTGEIVYTIQEEWTSISTSPSISPDGRFAVAGAWDDPQDRPTSQDFKIWDMQTGEVVYESPQYRSVWGTRTIGGEVYPRFSSDGNYLIVPKEGTVELYRVLLQRGTTNPNQN